MSNNQTSPDATPKVFESFDRRLNYKREGYESAESATSLSWDSNPILKRIASELNIETGVGTNKGIVLTSGDPFPTFGAKLGKLLGEGESELSFSFLGQLDLGITNAMSDVLEVYNGAEMIQLPEGVTPDKLKATIEQTILKYMEYSVTSGRINIGVEGIQDYVSRYNELLTRASALIILQSPSLQGANRNKEIIGEQRVNEDREIERIKASGKDEATIEKEIEEWKFNHSDKVMKMLGTMVFNGSMKRMGEQLEVIRGIVALNSAIDKYKINVDAENDKKNNKRIRAEQEIVKTPSPAFANTEPRQAFQSIQTIPTEDKPVPDMPIRNEYGKEGAPLGERVVRNFIILTGALRIRALPTRGENDNTDNGKDNLRVERFIDKVDGLLRNEFNRVTLTLVSVAIFPFVATAYGIRSATESQGLKDVFEKIFGPTPEPKPDNDKIDTKDRPEPGILATKFLSFFERVLPKWKGNPDSKDNKLIVDDGDTGFPDVKYRYALAVLALIPLLCVTGATLESLFNRTFRGTSGLNTQMPEFPVAGQSAPIQSPASIGSVVGNTNAGTFQDPAAGEVGMPDMYNFPADASHPNINPLYRNIENTKFIPGDTMFSKLEKAGYDPINELYNPDSDFYKKTGEAAVIIRLNYADYPFVKGVFDQIAKSPNEATKRLYNDIKNYIGGGLPSYEEFLSNPNNKIDGIHNVASIVTNIVGPGQIVPSASYIDFTNLLRYIPEGNPIYVPKDSAGFKTDVENFMARQNKLIEEEKAPTP